MMRASGWLQGTITMVVIKNDERTGRFRDRSGSIKAYSKANHIPKVSIIAIPSDNSNYRKDSARCKPCMRASPGIAVG